MNAHHISLWPLVHESELYQQPQQAAVLALTRQLTQLRAREGQGLAPASRTRAGGLSSACPTVTMTLRSLGRTLAHGQVAHQRVLTQCGRLELDERALRKRARQLARVDQRPALTCREEGAH